MPTKQGVGRCHTGTSRGWDIRVAPCFGNTDVWLLYHIKTSSMNIFESENASIHLPIVAMTKQDDYSVATNVPVIDSMEPHIKGEDLEPTPKDLAKDKAGEGVGASPDDGVPGGRMRDTKARETNCRRRFFTHALWAIVASLLVIFAVNQFKPAMVTQPYHHKSSVQDDQSATTIPRSLPRDTTSSPPSFWTPRTRRTVTVTVTERPTVLVTLTSTVTVTVTVSCLKYDDKLWALITTSLE